VDMASGDTAGSRGLDGARTTNQVNARLANRTSWFFAVGPAILRATHPESRDERELASEHGHDAAQHGTLAAR